MSATIFARLNPQIDRAERPAAVLERLGETLDAHPVHGFLDMPR